MRFERLLSWWVILPYLLLALGAAGWQIWRIRRLGKVMLLRWSRRGLMLILPALVALGPSVPGGTSAPGITNLDVIVAVDTTPSMGALDYAGAQQRIEGAKKDALALAAKFRGARLEVITFDSEANVILPFTSDETAFSEAIQGMSPEPSSYSQGSAIDKPIDLITQELKNSKALYPQHNRLLFYMGDGEQTSSTAVKSFAPIAPYLSGGAVLGYGTVNGAKMINNTGVTTSGSASPYITTINATTKTLMPAVSKMSPPALQQIAAQLKVTYRDRNLGGPISDAYRASQAPLIVDKAQHIIRYLNLYWLLAVPLAGLVFWEWQSLVIKLLGLREVRGKKHA